MKSKGNEIRRGGHAVNILKGFSFSQPLARAGRALKQDRGVTGLETAIILIAFVVVASVFAFTVLSTGIFSAERGKETIHAGLKGARSSLALKGSIVANGSPEKVLSVADSVWTSSGAATSTVTLDTSDKKEGTGSADVQIHAGSITGLAAYFDLSATVDLSSIDSIKLWVKSGSSTASGDIEIVVDDTAGCLTPLENLDLPGLVADTWKLVTLAITDNSDMTAVKCVGLSMAVDNGSILVNLDEVVAQGQATSILVTITNTLEGEPIDVSEPSDADGDGNADSDSGHTMILTYTDKNQVVRDVYWTKTFIGNNDSDDLLEAGEKVEINVRLGALSNTYPVIGDVKWDIEIRPEDGGTVVIQRIMPDIIDTVMNLN
jgi:flagellin-like protein